MADARAGLLCECEPVSEATFSEAGDQSPSMAVVEALAAANGVTPTELRPLDDVVDCDALDRLCERGDRRFARARTFRFCVDGWNVFVRDDGRVRVCDPHADVEPAPVFERAVDG